MIKASATLEARCQRLAGDPRPQLLPTLALTALLLGPASCGDGPTTDPGPLPAFPARVSVSPDSVELPAIGATVQLSAQVFDENGNVMTDEPVAWTSSDAVVASVDGTGLVTAAGNGTATITATARAATGSATVTVADPDRLALVALYEATNGPGWVNSDGWMTDAPLADWYGVTVDTEGRVAGLDLAGRWEAGETIRHGLEGSLPPEIGNMSSLEYLDLNRNELSGPIPPALGNLSSLEYLDLSDNALTGPIPPELGNLSNLVDLRLAMNALSGTIPPEIGNLSSLRWLYLFRNALVGPIPPELGNLSNLVDLSLDRNALSGTIPPELGNLSSLVGLVLSRNTLTGSIPSELGNLSNLWYLNLTINQLTGPIPESFLGIEGLDYFFIAHNDSLCVPNTPAFLAWLGAIPNRDRESVLCASASNGAS